MEHLQFTPSESGLLMYIERTEDYGRSFHGGPYSSFRGANKAAYETLQSKKEISYDPERITWRLHVLTPDGKDKYAVAIANKYGGEFEKGLFLNDHRVVLRFTPRNGPALFLMVVALDTGKVFSLARRGGIEIGGVSCSSNGKSFAVEMRDCTTSASLLFLDGTMILPYYDLDPPVPFVSPEEYDKRVERFTKRSGDYRGFALEGHSWSADGRFLFFVQPKGYRDDPGKPAASEPSLLILDTEKAGPGKDYRDYCLRVPFQLPEDMQKKVDRSNRDSQRLVPTLLESENAVELVLQGRPEAKFRVPLPPNWKNVDTIRGNQGQTFKFQFPGAGPCLRRWKPVAAQGHESPCPGFEPGVFAFR